MNYFQELTIIKSPEMSPYFVWSKLYTQVHLALVEQARATYGEQTRYGDIGVSFPEYNCFEKNGKTIAILGSKLRVFAKTEMELQQLNLNKWCERLLDYVHIKSAESIEGKATSNVHVKRLRQNRNNDRITRAYARKHNLTFDTAREERIARFAEKHQISIEESKLHYHSPVLKTRPYIHIESQSSKQGFSLEIDQVEADREVAGVFNTYGLSGSSTVPHW